MKKCASAQFTTAGFLRSIHARSAIHAPKTHFTGAVKNAFFTAPLILLFRRSYKRVHALKDDSRFIRTD